MQLSPKAQRSLRFVGKNLADIRPDLNDKASDEAIVTAALMILHSWMIIDAPIDQIVSTCFTDVFEDGV